MSWLALGVAGEARVCDIDAVDAAAHYRQLLQLGRTDFLSAAAPGALVRYRVEGSPLGSGGSRSRDEQDEVARFGFARPRSNPAEVSEETLPHGTVDLDAVDLQVFPLAKKPGASFADRITIGRTSNNDVVIADASVSRLHAYVRRDGNAWLIADAGSKNGSWLRGSALEPRRERPLPSRALVKLGDVELTFYEALDLYAALGGSP
jgi:hypothetical protein